MLGYAVIDTETTGLNRLGNDKIAEIAVALYDLDFNLISKHETLLHPDRDLGLVSLHGINGLMASEAPRFREIMPSLAHLLHDRIIIGHNVSFDCNFIKSEYERNGVEIWLKESFIDTLTLARKLSLNVPNYKLGTLCEYFSIDLTDAHEAMGDVMATAELFRILVELNGNIVPKAAPFRFPSSKLRMKDNCSNWFPRKHVHEKLSAPYNLLNFLNTLPSLAADMPADAITSYLKTLHTSLINGSYSHRERGIMEMTTSSLSLSRSQVIDLNEEYLFLLICRNLHKNAGRWSTEDSFTMQTAMEFTGIRETRVEELTEETLANKLLIPDGAATLKSLFSLNNGDGLVLTGEDFMRGRSYWQNKLPASGFLLKDNTTKTGTKAVICNDPYSLSKKAVVAREYGIPVLTENTVTNLIKQA